MKRMIHFSVNCSYKVKMLLSQKAQWRKLSWLLIDSWSFEPVSLDLRLFEDYNNSLFEGYYLLINFTIILLVDFERENLLRIILPRRGTVELVESSNTRYPSADLCSAKW